MKIRQIVLLAVFLLAPLAVAGAAEPLADRLPVDSLLYVGWAGRSLTFDGSMVGQLLSEPAVDSIMASLKKALLQNIPPQGPGSVIAERAWTMAGIAWQHPIAISLIDVAGTPNAPMPSAVALIDLGKDRPAFEKALNDILAAAGKDLPLTDATAGAVSYKTFKPAPDAPEFVFGYIQDTFFLTMGNGVVKQLLQVTPETSLKSNKKFAQCMQAVGGPNAQGAFYADVSAIFDRVDKFMAPPGAPAGASAQPSDFRRIAAALGVGNVTAIAAERQIVDRGLYGKMKIFSKAPHQGLLMLAAGAPLTDADLAGVPEDADFMCALKLSPQAVYDEFRRVLRQISPQADAGFAQGQTQAENELGIQLSQDILSNLGDTWVLSSAASQGGFLTGTLLTVQVTNASKLTATVASIEGFVKGKLSDRSGNSGPAIQTVTSGGVDIHYVAVRGGFMPVAPAWVIYKDKLYVALFPQVIQSAIESSSKPLTQEASFAAARGKISGKPSALCYCNLPKIIRQVYNFGLVGWTIAANQLAGQQGIPARPDWLPPLAKIEKYLWPSIGAVSNDAEGITFEDYGSVPTMGLAAGPVAVAGAIGMPMVYKARQQAVRTSSNMNMIQIYQALQVYEVDKGQPPSSLGDLLKAQVIQGNVLVSPGSGHAAPALVGGEVSGTIDYVYIKPVPAQKNDPKTIILYEKQSNPQMGVWVLYGDGHTACLSQTAFQTGMAGK